MKHVEPKIYFIGSTQINTIEVDSFLHDIGASNFKSDAETDEEYLLELAGRACYRSFEPGLNKNVTKVREGNESYLQNVAKQLHGSVFAHASVNFILHDVSRVFTHELVRHAIGSAFSQESLRFVRLDDIKFWKPSVFTKDQYVSERCDEVVQYLENVQKELADYFDLDNPTKPFHEKKEITSAMRRLAPEGLGTTIVWSCNFRTLRHVIEMRTDPGAEEEIRLVFGKVAEIVKSKYPAAFGDYEIEIVKGLPHYKTVNRKI